MASGVPGRGLYDYSFTVVIIAAWEAVQVQPEMLPPWLGESKLMLPSDLCLCSLPQREEGCFIGCCRNGHLLLRLLKCSHHGLLGCSSKKGERDGRSRLTSQFFNEIKHTLGDEEEVCGSPTTATVLPRSLISPTCFVESQRSIFSVVYLCPISSLKPIVLEGY